ncbi:heat-shock protein, partial [Pseudomonas sp. MWU13-2625]
RVELAAILPAFGYRSLDPEGRELPNKIYFDLATWHLINTVYTPKRLGELKLMKHLYQEVQQYDRLTSVVEQRLGHALMARAEEAKIGVAAGGETMIDLNDVEEDLQIAFDADRLVDASRDDTARIVDAARETVRLAGVAPRDVGALYFTGGSTGLAFLSGALAGAFPDAQPVFGDRLASGATGLGIHAQRVVG